MIPGQPGYVTTEVAHRGILLCSGKFVLGRNSVTGQMLCWSWSEELSRLYLIALGKMSQWLREPHSHFLSRTEQKSFQANRARSDRGAFLGTSVCLLTCRNDSLCIHRVLWNTVFPAKMYQSSCNRTNEPIPTITYFLLPGNAWNARKCWTAWTKGKYPPTVKLNYW